MHRWHSNIGAGRQDHRPSRSIHGRMLGRRRHDAGSRDDPVRCPSRDRPPRSGSEHCRVQWPQIAHSIRTQNLAGTHRRRAGSAGDFRPLPASEPPISPCHDAARRRCVARGAARFNSHPRDAAILQHRHRRTARGHGVRGGPLVQRRAPAGRVRAGDQRGGRVRGGRMVRDRRASSVGALDPRMPRGKRREGHHPGLRPPRARA